MQVCLHTEHEEEEEEEEDQENHKYIRILRHCLQKYELGTGNRCNNFIDDT
jgi:hypothetical protein